MASADELRQMLKNNPELGVVNVADLPPGFFGKSPAKAKREEAEIRRHKYNAQRTEVDGITFDSKKEATEYQTLKLLDSVGAIADLQLQPAFELQAAYVDNNGKKVKAIIYKADFAYTQEGRRIVVDVKGMQTPVFKLKSKLFRERFPELQLLIK